MKPPRVAEPGRIYGSVQTPGDLGFCLAAGLAAGAAAAGVAAGIGGKHRDSELAPPLRFGCVRSRPA